MRCMCTRMKRSCRVSVRHGLPGIFLASSSSRDDSPVCVTYWINRLQALPPGAPQTFVTLNPERPPAPDKTLRKLSLAHPVYSFQSYQAQAALPGIQGIGSIYYAGAWCGYGFHEDGLKAGLAVAQLLGAGIPWVPRPCHPKISLRDQTGISVFRPLRSPSLLQRPSPNHSAQWRRTLLWQSFRRCPSCGSRGRSGGDGLIWRQRCGCTTAVCSGS
eukprot:jgi/Botrbrau1/11908/Bobra.0171s0018.1